MVTFRANIYKPLDRGMAVLQLCRWKFSHKETLQQTLFELSWLLFPKKRKIAFWATLSGLRGNVCTPSIGRWKAHGQIYIRRNWTFFAISYGWDVVSGNGRSRRSSKGWVTLTADLRGNGTSPTKHCWCQKIRVIAVSCGIKYPQSII